jgi:hypothetical protein
MVLKIGLKLSQILVSPRQSELSAGKRVECRNIARRLMDLFKEQILPLNDGNHFLRIIYPRAQLLVGVADRVHKVEEVGRRCYSRR